MPPALIPARPLSSLRGGGNSFQEDACVNDCICVNQRRNIIAASYVEFVAGFIMLKRSGRGAACLRYDVRDDYVYITAT